MKKPNWNIRVSGQGMSANEIVDAVMQSRNIADVDDFLNPSSVHIRPSEELLNIKQAAYTLANHNNSVLIYADTDTDGCTAAAIMYRYLSALNPDADLYTYINKGKDHGIQDYFNWSLLDLVDTVIVVDSINDTPDMYNKILDAGKHLIVLDHHIPSEEILKMQEQINLISSANNYSNPHLSGSGVCWKFCTYLDYLYETNYAETLADLATVGIIADVCDMMSMENRAICNQGFRLPVNNAILNLCKEGFDSTAISFNIAPLVNAANRMNRNDLALQLFISDNSKQVKMIIKELEDIRKQQKEKVSELMPNLLQEGDLQKDYKCAFFFIKDADNLGGLLATKLTATYHKPCLVLHDTGDNYEGSMRAEGVENFSKLVNDSGLGQCLGHENSAGICIPKCNFEKFQHYIEDVLSSTTFQQDLIVDLTIDRAQITPFLLSAFNNINRITGKNFEPIKVMIDGVRKYEIKQLSQGKHLSVNAPDMKFLYWNFNDWDKVETGGVFSAVGTLSENSFMGRKSIQMIMEDFYFAPSFKLTNLW